MNSIRRQLTRNLLLTLAVTAGLSLAAVYAAASYALRSSFDDELQARALAVSSLTEWEGGKVGFDFSREFLASYGGPRVRGYFEIWDGVGRVLTRSPGLGAADLPVPSEATPEHPIRRDITLPGGRSARAVGFQFLPTISDPPGSVFPDRPWVGLQVALDRHELDETLGKLLAALIGGGVLLLGGVLLTVPRLLRRGLEPLTTMAGQTERIHAGSLAFRFPLADLPRELEPVGRRFNDLLARLETSFERERRFSADLAHELRTPLAELRTMAECALKWPESRDPTTDRETLAIAQQMERIVANILALVRGEEGQLAAKSEPFAAAALVRDTWQRFASRAAERGLGVSLQLEAAGGLGDAALLRSILVNLCDNAVEYAPSGGEIALSVRRDAERVVITVANTANELEAADLPKLFDRFWRKEAARSGGVHVGLGLALSQTFAKAMGWELGASFDDQSRLVFTLAGPAAATPVAAGMTVEA